METMQEKYLQQILEKKLLATFFLTCNVKLRGFVKAFDEHSILIEFDGRTQLIYKHALSTLSAEVDIERINEQN